MSTRSRRTAALPPRRSCGTMAVHMSLLERYPQFRARQFQLEQDTARLRTSGLRAADLRVRTVKTVVNVVYKTDAQNVSMAQIRSQITVLNRDFAARNPDRSKVPTPWKGLVTDTRVRFKLVKVIRKLTRKDSFTDQDNGVKKAASGGMPPYRPESHLNLWVCALRDSVLGYAQFPGGPSATDGVVIHYLAFGTLGSARSPFNKGRTATHEVGHYFNLRHIWGDTPDCSGSDAVPDTPNSAGPNFNKPTFPTITCNNGPNGDMFMNYMDYVDDAAMFMFTAQQVARMRATLAGPRSGL
ncbi:MAG: zinc metalloprotease [Candidatus Eisenbacteria bacterium]|uniref:Zinc metalloprotease n=1 Tax=Eiseniibacteriota bacterium TaxID=2212470 RepID=A0A849SPE1_UNCEI|nr:zinc metalloprotease [Candidatus Eisenbacteria bacterium]